MILSQGTWVGDGDEAEIVGEKSVLRCREKSLNIRAEDKISVALGHVT